MRKFNASAKFFSSRLVKIPWETLKRSHSSVLFESIKDAYSTEGLGLLVIEDVPEHFKNKEKLLNLSYHLTNLPVEELRKVERPEINYSKGWAYGKEYFNDQPDLLKASYYASLPPVSNINNKYKDDNVWPEKLPELENAFITLGNQMRDVGLILLNVIDQYVKSIYPSYDIDYAKLIKESAQNTGRLLYYFPRNCQEKVMHAEDVDWCGWHNDHGSLTALASAMYLRNGVHAKDLALTKTGLHIQNRRGEIVRVTHGPNDIAFQLGETLQIHSGGLLHATPHSVQVHNDLPSNIARATFALFLEPNRDVKLTIPKEADVNDIKTSDIYKVPKIQDRFREGMTFGEFDDATFGKFYETNIL